MAFTFKASGHFKVRARGEYPWPCNRDPDRTIELFEDDILSRSSDGTFIRQSGLGCMGIRIQEKDIVYTDSVIDLQMI